MRGVYEFSVGKRDEPTVKITVEGYPFFFRVFYLNGVVDHGVDTTIYRARILHHEVEAEVLLALRIAIDEAKELGLIPYDAVV